MIRLQKIVTFVLLLGSVAFWLARVDEDNNYVRKTHLAGNGR